MNSSDPTTPDYHRRGSDLIARIDELARDRDIDPEQLPICKLDGNGWIWLLMACRHQLVALDQWKSIAKQMTTLSRDLTTALQGYQHIHRTIETLCGDATTDPTQGAS